MHASFRILLVIAMTMAVPLAAAAQSDSQDQSIPPAPDQPQYTIRETFPPLHPADPTARLPQWTIYALDWEAVLWPSCHSAKALWDFHLLQP